MHCNKYEHIYIHIIVNIKKNTHILGITLQKYSTNLYKKKMPE